MTRISPKGRTLITATFRDYATAMENIASVLPTNDRLTLLRLLKKLGKQAAEISKQS